MASQMLNFRAKDPFVIALDSAARAAGMNRSDFIRAALEQAVESDLSAIKEWARVNDNGERKRTTAPPMKKPKENCSHPDEEVVETQYGIKICKLCSSRVAKPSGRRR